jgi:NAD(P)-dependent dehydrogenase (short-subunit alcohol dehydrogenase family)
MNDEDLFDLAGKVVVVTGGSRGLGREMVLACARRGADVVVASRKVENCQAVAVEVEALGRQALAIGFHAASWSDADALVDAVVGRFGRIDVLINNAGMAPVYPSLDAVSEELFDKVVGVNLKGPFRLTALVGTRMMQADGGSIVNISSIASLKAAKTEAVYAAAKAGLNSLTLSFAAAFGPTVRVNCIVAGAFFTDISKAWDMPAFEARAQATYALQRGGDPSEVVGAALYFASRASSYTTGALLRVDGGAP